MKKKKQLPRLLAMHLGRMILIIMSFIVLFTFTIQIINSERVIRRDAARMFEQVERVLTRNEEEIDSTIEEYTEDCLRNANAIAYVLQDRPDIVKSASELRKLAGLMHVDEIHIFDTDGVIVYGTHEEYYGYSFDSGEQMNFFKPMLRDKKLSLVQEITPNTAEGKLVQYSAVWSDDEKFIVQIGMYPDNLLKLMEKNELPYIFSLLLTNDRVSLYAIDSEDHEILASTVPEKMGEKAENIGLDFKNFNIRRVKASERLCRVNNVSCLVYYKNIGENIIAYVYPLRNVAADVMDPLLMFAIGVLIMSAILTRSMMLYMNKYVVDATNEINEDLRSISEGNLDTVVSVDTCQEFSELSSHINAMVKSLMENTARLSYVLEKSKLKIGVYEYQENSSKVKYTSFISEVFKLAENKTICHRETFMRALERFKRYAVDDMTDVYEVTALKGNDELEKIYVHYEEEFLNGTYVGIVTDVTAQVLERKKIEKERDMDMLTGLYNRRGLENTLLQLRYNYSETGNFVLFMVDADGLKDTNDRYGHAVGDLYLKKIAEILSGIGSRKHITARLGGDEFVHFMYGYGSSEEASSDIAKVFEGQDTPDCELADELSIPVRYSAGYYESRGFFDLDGMLERADENMYENKRARKGESLR